jgi:hypothetical protein
VIGGAPRLEPVRLPQCPLDLAYLEGAPGGLLLGLLEDVAGDKVLEVVQVLLDVVLEQVGERGGRLRGVVQVPVDH